MINLNNFKIVLDVIGFSEVEKNIYEKKFNNNVFMRVDFAKKQLYFPDLIKGRNRNNGFNKNENL